MDSLTSTLKGWDVKAEQILKAKKMLILLMAKNIQIDKFVLDIIKVCM